MMIQTKYKPYPAYKKSGLERIAEIPEGWEVRRWRFVAKCNPVKSESLIDDNLEVQFVPMELVPAEGINLELTETKKAYEVQKGYTYFINNDVLIAKITPCFENGKGAIAQGLKNGIGFGTTELHVYRTYSNIVVNKYLFLISKLQAFRSLGAASMKGAAGQKRVTDLFIKDFIIPLPPLPEQQAIAAFLDRETARINGIVEKQTRMIGLLKEKRSALITKAVTKGLDPNVKLRPSGVEWIGEIPEHWEVRKLKFCSRCNSDILPENTNPNYEIEYLDIGNVDSEGNILATENCYFTDAPSRARRIPKATDTIISTVRTYLKAIAYLENIPKNFIVSTGFAVISGNSEILYAKYLYCFFCSHFFVESIMKESKGVSYPAINPTNLVLLFICLPPLTEQRAIADFLDRETAKIDKLIEKIEKQIELLNEYRQSLITSAVTGKIDVSTAINTSVRGKANAQNS